jgi:hypothetical protein
VGGGAARGLFGWLGRGGQGEQAGFGFGQDATFDQALEFGADAFGVFGFGADAKGLADVLGA